MSEENSILWVWAVLVTTFLIVSTLSCKENEKKIRNLKKELIQNGTAYYQVDIDGNTTFTLIKVESGKVGK